MKHKPTMKTKLILTNLAIMSAMTLTVFAQENIGIKNPIGANSISELIVIVTRVIRYVAIPFIVLFIMWAGAQFVLAQGNASKIEGAKKMLLWTLVGTMVVLSSELIANLLNNTLKNLAR